MTLSAVLAGCSGAAFLFYGVMCLRSPSMKREFARFGLQRFRVLTGSLEVLGGVGLLVGLWWPLALAAAAAGLALLMLLGVGVRVTARDSLRDTLPAVALMLVNVYILLAVLKSG